MKGRIIVDCDLVVINTDQLWIKWLSEVTGVDKRPLLNSFPTLKYNVSHYWQKELDHLDIDAYDFWRDKNLYLGQPPIDGSVRVLSDLHTAGYNIVFASHVKGYSGYSKALFLKENFPFLEGIVFTQEKWLVANQDTVAMIDDRALHLNSMPPHVTKVLIPTPYEQDEPFSSGTKIFNWGFGVNYFIYEILNVSKTRVYGFY